MKVYIAGRISGYKDFFQHFGKAEKELKEKGYIVLNPSMLPSGLEQQEYMSICIPMLYVSNAIYMLKGWENSVGAKIEHEIAKQANMQIIYE